jgi:putative flippase GtrA
MEKLRMFHRFFNGALFRQMLRYGAVGVGSLGVDVGLFMLLRSWGLDIVSCNVLARLVGALAAYSGNFFWTFEAKTHSRFWGGASLRYAALWVGSTALSTMGLTGLVGLGMPEPWAKLGMELSMPLFNFVMSRLWVFK